MVWTCGNGGIILHTLNGGEPLVGVQNLSTEIPDGFELKQNFPNPFNSKTIIKFNLKYANYISLIIYDVLGNQIKTLVNEKLNTGSYEVDFDAGNLTSGTYFYNFYINNILLDTKKLILLK